MSNIPTPETGNVAERPLPTKLGPKESFATLVRKIKEKAGIQATELGSTPDMVRYREDNMREYDGKSKSMGVQADVVFEGTRYQQAFDTTIQTLLDFARSGDKSNKWGGLDEKESPAWGRYRAVELPNGRRYQVVDENREGFPVGRALLPVSVGPDYDYYKQKAEAEGRDFYDNIGKRKQYEEGAYNFYGGGYWTGRKVEICGAQMPGGVDAVMDDIKQVLAQASKALRSPVSAK